MEAQSPKHFIFDTEQGLPSSEVYDVYEDYRGFLWFTTDRGVVQYDSYQFKVFTTNDGLGDNTNFKIRPDGQGGLWFTGFNGTLSYHRNGYFQSYESQHGNKDVVVNLFVEPSGRLILAHRFGHYQLDCFNPSSSKAESIPIHTDTLCALPVHPVTRDYLFILPGNGLMHQSVKLGSVFVCCREFADRELHVFNSVTGATFKLPVGRRVNALYVADSCLWVATNKGLLSYRSGNLNQLPEVYFDQLDITGILKDREGNYWLTTVNSGVVKVPSFQIHSFGQQYEGIKNNRIGRFSIFKDNLVIGVFGRDLWKLEPNKTLSKVCEGPANYYRIFSTDNNVHAGNIVYSGNSVRKLADNENNIFTILRNGDTLYNEYLGFRLENQGKKIRLEISTPAGISFWYEDRAGNLWMCSSAGLTRYAENNYRVIPFAAQQVLQSVRVNHVCESSFGGWLFAATMGKGVIAFHPGKKDTFTLDELSGLAGNMVNRLLITHDSLLWVATNQGLSVVSFRLKKNQLLFGPVRTFTAEEGLASNFINDLILWENQIWLATNKGLNYMNPFIPKDMDKSPSLILDYLSVNGEHFLPDSSICLKYYQNDVVIAYTGISHRKQAKTLLYSWRLLSSATGDSTWYYTTSRTVPFLNLGPGNYTFQVTAQNKGYSWSPIQTIQFIIKPHFSQTAWFRVLIVTVSMAILSGAVYLRYLHIRRRREEQQRLKDMELDATRTEIQSLRSQMNPHFIFNSLNSIQSFLFSQNFQKANQYITRLARLIRSSLTYSYTGQLEIQEEMEFLRNYLALEKIRFNNRFTFFISCDEQLEAHTLVPSLLVQPLVENCVKHAFAAEEENAIIRIHFALAVLNAIKVTVEDNGVGFDPQNLSENAMGIRSVQNRLQLLSKEYPQCDINLAFFALSNYGQKGMRAVLKIPIIKQ